MQIILIQNEIEQAIKDYVNKRLTVSEGTDITIDLSATRGPEGIKAIIDLVPSTPAAPAGSLGAVKRTATAASSKPITHVAVADAAKESPKTGGPAVVVVPKPALVEKPAPATAVEAVAETAQDESEGVEEGQGSTEAVETAETTGEVEEAEVVEEVAAAPATPPVRSLFANLRKPVNNPS